MQQLKRLNAFRKEKELSIEEIMHTGMIDVGAELFKEANVKLKSGLKTKDLKQIKDDQKT